jgi:hypothetical protein
MPPPLGRSTAPFCPDRVPRGRKLFHITSVEQTYCDTQANLKSFAVTVAGPYETLVCAACGFAEWYASKSALDKLTRMAEARASRFIDGDAAPRRSSKSRAKP